MDVVSYSTQKTLIMKPCHIRTRVPVRTIPCDTCGKPFGQTAYEVERKLNTCVVCKREIRNTTPPVKYGAKRKFDVVLPKRAGKAHYDRRRDEWCLRIQIRKKGSKDPWKWDRLLLGVKGEDADMTVVNAAYAATYARQQMLGAFLSVEDADPVLAKRKYRKLRNSQKWAFSHDKDLGITKARITVTMYKVYLPDPMVDGKKIYCGRYPTRKEAREARNIRYKEMKYTFKPCGCCGGQPTVSKGRVTHHVKDCPNKVQLPCGVRPLLQAKLWNLVFSSGQVKDAAKVTKDQLCRMGYLKVNANKTRYVSRSTVEFNFSKAKDYAQPFDPPPEPEDDVMFE